MKAPFDYSDYREFLKNALPIEGEGRGARNRLAEALRCQKGFISQVLGGRAHFSLEHGTKISRFLGLDSTEEEYFLLLLHLGRAGSKELENFYKKRMSEISERRKQITERIRSESKLSEADQMRYYSSWHYTAVHMCLMVPELRTPRAIAAYLGLSLKQVNATVQFLASCGLAVRRGEQLDAGPARIHLASSSPLVAKHHTNWRMRAIDAVDNSEEQDLHYSLIMSLSEEAAAELRELFLKTIQAAEPILKAAADKTVYALNVDLFGLRKSNS